MYKRSVMNKKVKAVAASVGAAATYAVASAQAMVVYAQDGSAPGLTNSKTIGSGGFATQVPAGYAYDFGNLLSFILRAVLAVGALLVFAYLVLGGIEYITSGGDKGKTEKSRDKITAAIIGLIILAASWAILNLALSFLGLGSIPAALENVGNINNL